VGGVGVDRRWQFWWPWLIDALGRLSDYVFARCRHSGLAAASCAQQICELDSVRNMKEDRFVLRDLGLVPHGITNMAPCMSRSTRFSIEPASTAFRKSHSSARPLPPPPSWVGYRVLQLLFKVKQASPQRNIALPRGIERALWQAAMSASVTLDRTVRSLSWPLSVVMKELALVGNEHGLGGERKKNREFVH